MPFALGNIRSLIGPESQHDGHWLLPNDSESLVRIAIEIKIRVHGEAFIRDLQLADAFDGESSERLVGGEASSVGRGLVKELTVVSGYSSESIKDVAVSVEHRCDN